MMLHMNTIQKVTSTAVVAALFAAGVALFAMPTAADALSIAYPNNNYNNGYYNNYSYNSNYQYQSYQNYSDSYWHYNRYPYAGWAPTTYTDYSWPTYDYNYYQQDPVHYYDYGYNNYNQYPTYSYDYYSYPSYSTYTGTPWYNYGPGLNLNYNGGNFGIGGYFQI